MTEMNDLKLNPAPAARKPVRSALVFGLALVAGAAVLYGFVAPGKKAASAECSASVATAARIAPFARGEVASLSVSKALDRESAITFGGPDGQPRSLADFRGRTVLLNLWATWCVPCREEMPALDKLQAKFGGPDFEVVAVNIDTTRLDRRQTFLKDAGVTNLAFYADPGADVFQILKKAGKVTGLPTTMLVDAQGCELAIMPGQADWASQDAAALITAALGR